MRWMPALLLGMLLTIAGVARAADAEKSAATPSPAAAAPAPLSPEMTALRDRIRGVLTAFARQPANAAANTPREILLFCQALGCDAQMSQGQPGTPAVTAVGYLCWNYPCAGYQLLTLDGDRPIARVGYGLQSRPGEMLATLALARVGNSYELRIGDRKFTIADLVQTEKRLCASGSAMALPLIGLQHYLETDESWDNAVGETWSLEKLVQSELDRGATTEDDAFDRLLGLTLAVRRQEGKPASDIYARAERHLAELQQHALKNAGADGYWHPGIVGGRPGGRDLRAFLSTTGRGLQWLAYRLPPAELESPAVVKTADYLARTLQGQYAYWNIAAASPLETAAVAHAVGALRLYDSRVIAPKEAKKPEAPKADEAKKA